MFLVTTKARDTNSRSILLNLALLTLMLLLPFLAKLRTSVPMYSPSRSQSVHINKTFAPRASSWIFFAMIFFCYNMVRMYCTEGSTRRMLLYIIFDSLYDRSFKHGNRITGGPCSILGWKVYFFRVSRHCRHGHLAIVPRIESVREVVILDILIPCFSLSVCMRISICIHQNSYHQCQKSVYKQSRTGLH